jgi:D-arabinose 1-dehydrogenase-like Zn-dependent alcohol dehydrogenase
MMVVGNVVPERVSLNLGYIITYGIELRGSAGATPRDMEAVFAMYEQRPFEVCIDRQLPLEDADRAQRLVKAGGLRGRVVLVP